MTRSQLFKREALTKGKYATMWWHPTEMFSVYSWRWLLVSNVCWLQITQQAITDSGTMHHAVSVILKWKTEGVMDSASTDEGNDELTCVRSDEW